MPARPFRVIALAVLLPALVAAQPATDAPHTEAKEPPHVARTQPSPQAAPSRPRARAAGDELFPLGARLVGETVGGAMIGATGLAVALLGGVLVTDRVSCPYNECAKSRRASLLSAAVGMGLGAASGTYLAGSLMDAHGGLLPTMLGGLVGTSVPLTVIALTDGELPWPALVAAYAAPVATSILAFELSHGVQRKRRQAPHTGLTLVPTAAVAPGGGTLGLAGRF